MSAELSLSLIVGGLLVVALVWVAVTWPGRRSLVVWRRVPDSRDVHAIRKVDLRANTPDVESVGVCGRWPVAELTRAKRPDTRCPVCVREVEKLERGGT